MPGERSRPDSYKKIIDFLLESAYTVLELKVVRYGSVLLKKNN